MGELTAEIAMEKAIACDRNADAWDAKARGEYRLSVLSRLWLESNRQRASARRWRRKASALTAPPLKGEVETDV